MAPPWYHSVSSVPISEAPSSVKANRSAQASLPLETSARKRTNASRTSSERSMVPSIGQPRPVAPCVLCALVALHLVVFLGRRRGEGVGEEAEDLAHPVRVQRPVRVLPRLPVGQREHL